MSDIETDNIRPAALAVVTSWVASIADRVNNPVASTIATLSIVERELAAARRGDPLDDALVTASISRIKVRLGHLSDYIRELSNFGKPDQFSPVDINLPSAFTSVLSEMEPRGGSRAEWQFDFGATEIYADLERLKVALRCLVSNGWDATARCEIPRLSVASSTDLAGGVRICIEDNGPGFSQAANDHAGEPFYSTKEAGTGLGLAIVRKFVAAHGGHLLIERSSSLGGARVTLTLPPRTLEVKS